MEEGGVSRLERRGYGSLGFRMAKRGRWEGVKHDLGMRLSKMYGVLQKYPPTDLN